MSATLTWASSGLVAKTGTARDDLFTDLNTLVTSKAGDATFRWQVASFSIAGNPRYLTLKRKNGSDGRILLLGYTAAPAAANTAIFDVAAAAVSTTSVLACWFPNGNVDTPSNLAAASGTILGNDTNCVKATSSQTIASIYAALFQAFYFESEEGIWFCFQNPASNTSGFAFAAGDLLVDAADNAYGCTIGATATIASFGDNLSQFIAWAVAAPLAGSSSLPAIRTNYGSANRSYFHGFSPNGAWADSAVGAGDILTDTSLNRVWFVPVQLLGQTKGEGFVLKHRQLGYGPGTTGAFATYATTGPVTAALQMNSATAGGVGFPWLTNFKI